MTESSATQTTGAPLSMVFAPTATVPESLLADRKTAAEEAQLAFTTLDNFSQKHLKEGHTEFYRQLVNRCQTGLTAASQGNDPQICGQVLPRLCETLEGIPFSVTKSHLEESQEFRRVATAKFQKLFALAYATMCASLGDTLAPEEMRNPRFIEEGWYEVRNMYGQSRID
jgi:hypothetical protein